MIENRVQQVKGKDGREIPSQKERHAGRADCLGLGGPDRRVSERVHRRVGSPKTGLEGDHVAMSAAVCGYLSLDVVAEHARPRMREAAGSTRCSDIHLRHRSAPRRSAPHPAQEVARS